MSAATQARPAGWRRVFAVMFLRDAYWSANWRRRALRVIVLGLGYGYVALVVVLLALENVLLHPGAYFRPGWREPPAGTSPEEITLRTQTGHTILAWWFTPPGWRPEHGAVHFSHGNGENVSFASGAAVRWQGALGRAVLVYEYPGYGKSTGGPTEAGCYAAAEAAYRWLVDAAGVPPGEVVLVGNSLGGAMATEMATRHRCALLVLIAPFTSFPDIAQHKVPFVPARWLVRNRMDNRAKVARVNAPVFVAHGDADAVVPYFMGVAVFEAARAPARFWPMPGQGHVHPRDSAFFDAVRAFLAEARAN